VSAGAARSSSVREMVEARVYSQALFERDRALAVAKQATERADLLAADLERANLRAGIAEAVVMRCALDCAEIARAAIMPVPADVLTLLMRDVR
jgi:hypothetical protein